MRPVCCELPVFRIENFSYGSVIKSEHFHYAPLQDMKSTLPYPHRHDFFHIVWVERGTGLHIIDEVTYEVRPGTLFFMAPAQIHDFRLSEDAEGHTVSFSAEFFALQLQDKNMLRQIPIFDSDSAIHALYTREADRSELRRTFQTIRSEYELDAFRAQDMIRSYLFILLVKASRLAVPASGCDANHRSQLLFRRFQQALGENFASLQAPAGYADMLGTTERALNEATRRCAGLTTAQLIRDRVILEAKRLLAHSGAQVALVGAQLGFDDPAYFSRCFKKHTGRTPIEFRQSLARMSE